MKARLDGSRVAHHCRSRTFSLHCPLSSGSILQFNNTNSGRGHSFFFISFLNARSLQFQSLARSILSPSSRHPSQISGNREIQRRSAEKKRGRFSRKSIGDYRESKQTPNQDHGSPSDDIQPNNLIMADGGPNA